MKRDVELMNLYASTSGLFPGEGEISPFDFKDRVESASRAGFKGMGLWHTDLEHILQQRTLKEMKIMLDCNGISYLELEFLTDWFLDGARKAESDARKTRLFKASEALGAKHIKIGDFYSSVAESGRVLDAFAALCEEAKAFGATIGFEFMPCSMINTLAGVLALIGDAGQENGGLILDLCHVVNLGIGYDELRRIPLEYIVNVELNDGSLPGSPGHDPSARLFCGEGDYDVRGFIECLKSRGYSGPWAVEVFNRKLAGLPLDELNKRAFASTVAQFSP